MHLSPSQLHPRRVTFLPPKVLSVADARVRRSSIVRALAVPIIWSLIVVGTCEWSVGSAWAQSFNSEVLVSGGAGGVQQAPASALDPNGNPFVVFVESGEILVSAGANSGQVTLALTSSGLPHSNVDIHINPSNALATVVFEREVVLGAGQNDIFYIASNGGVFGVANNLSQNSADDVTPAIAGTASQREVVWAQGTPGSSTIFYSVDLDPAVAIAIGSNPKVGVGGGVRYVLYERNGDLLAQVDSGAGFGPELSVATNADAAAIAVDALGTAHVTYESSGALFYKSSNGLSFSGALPIGNSASQADIDHRDGLTTVLYIEAGDVWSVNIDQAIVSTPIAVTTTPQAEQFPCIDIDQDGFLRVAYVRGGDVYARNNVAVPQAAFSNNPTLGEQELFVEFSDLSQGVVTSWAWDFGDGNTSGVENPTHVYEEIGAYTVTLTVSGAGGTDTLTRANAVRVTAASNIMRVPELTIFEGQNQITIPIVGTHESAVQGYQLSFSWDCTALEVTDVTLDNTVSGVLSPEFYSPNLLGTPTCAFTMGMIYDTVPPFDGRTLAAGVDHRLLNIVCDVPFGIAPVTTVVDLRDDIGDPPIFNVYTVGGRSVVPFLIDGIIHVEPFVFPPPLLFIRGDANLSGNVALPDVIFLLNYLFQSGTEPPCFDAGDVDDSGALGLTDVIFLLNYLFLGTDVPPYPNPSSGLDPTADTLPDC